LEPGITWNLGSPGTWITWNLDHLEPGSPGTWITWNLEPGTWITWNLEPGSPGTWNLDHLEPGLKTRPQIVETTETISPPKESIMPVEVSNAGTVSYTGEDGIALFRLITLRSALSLQARTGMKMSRVSAVACAKRLGFKGRTAAQLLADLEQKHPELCR
jgi:hypothetical protein